MNPLLKARALVIVFWALGMPLIILSFVAIPQALSAGALAARLSWSVVPVLGLVLMVIAVVRLVRRADDYHRARLLESFAVTAAVTAFWTSGYSLLESVGFPPLHLFWVPLSMTVTWAIWSLGRGALGR